jgi:hypothetical protein
MTERLVRPIRAWADYDEWRWFMRLREEIVVHKYYAIPQGSEGEPFTSAGLGVVQGLVQFSYQVEGGPLRSLRVLYENGWWLQLDPIRGGITTAISDWFWYLHQGTDDPEIPHGRFAEDKDSEAVERAMIAASAWFTQADPATLEIDSPPPEPAS